MTVGNTDEFDDDETVSVMTQQRQPVDCDLKRCQTIMSIDAFATKFAFATKCIDRNSWSEVLGHSIEPNSP